MWQRFTETARRVIFLAQEEAHRFGENYVGTEHILLGLIREGDSVANKVLKSMGLMDKDIRDRVESRLTRGASNLGGDMQLTPRAKRVIDYAFEETQALRMNYIGTEHLLLGLIRENDGLAAKVLTELGANLHKVRVYVALIHQKTHGETSLSTLISCLPPEDLEKTKTPEGLPFGPLPLELKQCLREMLPPLLYLQEENTRVLAHMEEGEVKGYNIIVTTTVFVPQT